MWADSTETRKLIEEVSKSIVVEVASDELPLFDELAQDYFTNPQPPRALPSDTDDPLGFGLESFAVVTPAALAMVQAVVLFLGSEVVKATRDEVSGVVRNKIKAMFKSGKSPQSPPPLSAEQLKQINDLARQQALTFGMSGEVADKIARALVGSLVLAE